MRTGVSNVLIPSECCWGVVTLLWIVPVTFNSTDNGELFILFPIFVQRDSPSLLRLPVFEVMVLI